MGINPKIDKIETILTGLLAATPPSMSSKLRLFPLSLVVKECAGRKVGAADVPIQISEIRALLRAFSFACTKINY